ncbi:hypothetical protein OKW32_005436 [Paraburkholderia youngii]
MQAHRIGARQRRAGQPDIQRKLGRHHVQKAARADIGHEADARLRHRDAAALGHDAQSRRLAEAHAAAHRDTVEQRDHRLRKRVQRVVQPVFVDEEREPARVALRCEPMHLAHVAARAKALVAGAFQHQRDDSGISAALLDQHGELAHHCVRQRVERSRAVQRDDCHTVDDAKQHVRFGLRIRRIARFDRNALQSAHRCVSLGAWLVCQHGARFSRNALTPSR